MSLDRRDFLKKFAAAQAGLMLGKAPAGDAPAPDPQPKPAPRSAVKAADVIVVGAGAFGAWTAYYLRQLGASVKLVDAYGPGNSRATSGDETRGVRSSYGDKGVWAELWMDWANQAIDRWTTFDARFNKPRIGRIHIAFGFDAVECAFSTIYGAANLTGFNVWTYQVDPALVRLGDPVELSKRLDGTPELKFAQQ